MYKKTLKRKTGIERTAISWDFSYRKNGDFVLSAAGSLKGKYLFLDFEASDDVVGLEDDSGHFLFLFLDFIELWITDVPCAF